LNTPRRMSQMRSTRLIPFNLYPVSANTKSPLRVARRNANVMGSAYGSAALITK
jgi:hypothetical protein